MQLLEVERIDALVEESRDLGRAYLMNLAVNGRDQNTLETARRDLRAKLSRQPLDSWPGEPPRARTAEEIMADFDDFAAKQWRTSTVSGMRWVPSPSSEVS